MSTLAQTIAKRMLERRRAVAAARSPDGSRLDLFACKTRKGWFASGAEVTAAAPSKRGRVA